MVNYIPPKDWLIYDRQAVFGPLTEAKAAVLSLMNMPYQRSWVEALQAIQLKREVAGTSKIEGADFTDRELDLALKETAEQLVTRSQKQAHAAMKAYKWISNLEKDRPINCDLIKEIHALIIGDADSDHCEPGAIRRKDENVVFGIPPHRGCEGGEECEQLFKLLGSSVQREFRDHELLIQALALHYHFAAMHPFLDGNGRTARAVEALMLQRAGLTDHLFIAMSNYYYDEKTAYLSALSSVEAPNYDLTPFLLFGLKGIKIQCERLFKEIRSNVSKSIFKNTMYDLFGRLQTERRAVIAKRHIAILNRMLEIEEMTTHELLRALHPMYESLKVGRKAVVRDLIHLLNVGALAYDSKKQIVAINLNWPQTITESGFMEAVRKMPKAKSYSFPTVPEAIQPSSLLG
ncbi:MAG TPA: Fic family protein [Lacunisphaera sp.]|jgi:Fic family protein